MEALLVRRRNLKSKLTRTKNKIDANIIEPLDIDEVEILEEQLEEIWSEINLLLDEIMTTCPVDAQDTHEEAFGVINERYYDAKLTLRRIARAIRPEANTGARPSGDGNAPRTTTIASVKLPKLDLPTFSGELLEWMQFRDLFRSTVHNQPLEGALKLKFLMKYLSGEAAKLIENYPVTDANYVEAWNVLEKRYQNDRELVRCQIVKFNKQNYLKEKSATGLRSLLDTSTSCILGLKALQRLVSVDDANDWVTFGIMERLDPETRELWEAKLGRNVMPKLSELLEFLDDRVSYLNASTHGMHQEVDVTGKTSSGKKTVSAHPTSTSLKCNCCNAEDHFTYNCPDFLKMTVVERRDKVMTRGMCFNCLRTGHAASDCSMKAKCKICKKRHNTLLHIDYPVEPAKSASEIVTAHATNNDGCQNRGLLATAMVTLVDANGNEQQFRAFLDPGAEVSFITENAVQLLGLQKRKTEITISGLSSNQVGTSRSIVKLNLKSNFDKDFYLEANAYVMRTITGMMPKNQLSEFETSIFKGLPLADPNYAQPGQVDVLLGADVFFEILRDGRLVGKPGLPVGQATVWGYVIGGKCPSQVLANTVSVHHSNVEGDLDQTLQQFWEQEEIPKKRFCTEEEIACEEHFVATHRRDEEGRYVVRLPFRKNVPALGKSMPQAIKRLHMMERHLSRKPERKEQYITFMREHEQLGHMELIPDDEIETPEGEHYYLPHHPVIKDESTSTKLRVVFDASAKTTSNVSLNDGLMTGGKLQDDLFAHLVRFLLYLVAMKADICKMYRQIWVDKRDCNFLRIVWRESPDHPIRHYRLLTVTYGTSVAPFLAKRCLEQLAKDLMSMLPEPSIIALRDFYMDDLMSGQSNDSKAIYMYKQLYTLLMMGGFELRKWTSNSFELLSAIPAQLRETQVPFKIDETDTVKTLGLEWVPHADHFKFKVTLSNQIASTKRQVSSAISKVFDPLGWISPVTIRAKILLQDLWRSKLTWDEKLFDSIQKVWTQYYEDLVDLEVITIPRCIYDESYGTFHLYGFCDASQSAYAAVVYISTTNQDGCRCVNLIAAKSKVAPIKQVSLPRLELCGAVLLARLVEVLIDAMPIKPESVHAWSDSTIVLEWLKGHASQWNTYVANRVSHIQSILPAELWHHVKGIENPADCTSRGITPKELANHPLWWHGPSWLKEFPTVEFEDNYEVDMEQVFAEQKKSAVIHHAKIESDFWLLHRYSSLPKILRITALCLRFIANARRKYNERNFKILSVNEMTTAMQLWLKLVQNAEFSDEIDSLSKKNPLPSKSRITNLNPFIDTKELIRVGGRLKHAKLKFEQKFPILLPKKHRLTELIITYEHAVNLHAGAQLLVATLQRKYWIIGVRDIVRYWVRKCIVCCRHRADMANQFMGDLPAVRVNPERPFLKTGVDYAGPITLRVIQGRGHRHYKGYIAIFVCLVTKAMHLELVSGLTTQAFIAAFRRFTGRRGKCSDLYSDCGKTFVGAQKELKILASKAYNEELNRKLIDEMTNFHFNPPGAPHFGGLWEAGIKSVKHHLRRVMGNSIFNFEEMMTMLVQIEACLNSRPISPLSRDPEDLQPLTPGHFLIHDALTSLPEPNLRSDNVSSLTRWQLVQRTYQDFWRRWSKEYLTRLQQRPQWLSKKKNVEVGDLVLIKDERYPPLKWKLGRVQKVHPGSDGLVRVVSLKTSEGEITRPVSKLSLLPLENNST